MPLPRTGRRAARCAAKLARDHRRRRQVRAHSEPCGRTSAVTRSRPACWNRPPLCRPLCCRRHWLPRADPRSIHAPLPAVPAAHQRLARPPAPLRCAIRCRRQPKNRFASAEQLCIMRRPDKGDTRAAISPLAIAMASNVMRVAALGIRWKSWSGPSSAPTSTADAPGVDANVLIGALPRAGGRRLSARPALELVTAEHV